MLCTQKGLCCDGTTVEALKRVLVLSSHHSAHRDSLPYLTPHKPTMRSSSRHSSTIAVQLQGPEGKDNTTDEQLVAR